MVSRPRPHQHDTLVILGPTASGKTRVGVNLAHTLGGEIISADSRQVYVGCDLGSGKDLEEYQVQGAAVPYRLIDIADLREEYNVFAYQRDFYRVYGELRAREVTPVVVGGTGLYLDAVLRGYRMVEAPENPALRSELAGWDNGELRHRLQSLKPKQHNTTDLDDRERLIRAIEIAECERFLSPEPVPDLKPLILGLRWSRAALRARIEARLRLRLDAGLLEEVQGLHDGGVAWERLDRLGLEYRAVGQYLRGEFESREAMTERLTIDIGQFAKRQETWFRRMERQGRLIHWIDGADVNAAMNLVLEQL